MTVLTRAPNKAIHSFYNKIEGFALDLDYKTGQPYLIVFNKDGSIRAELKNGELDLREYTLHAYEADLKPE